MSIIKMSQGAIIAGALVMAVCCSSSSVAMLMMGGEETPSTTGPGGSGGSGGSGGTPPPDFIIVGTGDRVGGDVLLTPDQTLDQCKALCKANDDCIGISYHEGNKTCYQKNTSVATDYADNGYQFYYKNLPKYEVKGAGDRVMGDMDGMPVTKTSLLECSKECDSKTGCVGFSYNSSSDTCYAKKAEGLVTDYVQNTFQFYTKRTP